MTLKEQYELLRQVFEEGKTLQWYSLNSWKDVSVDSVLDLTDPSKSYRIKPQPKRYWIKGHLVLFADLPSEQFMKDKGWKLVEEVVR